MTVTAPPRPPRPSDPVNRAEVEALVEALFEEARQRTRRRRGMYGAGAALVLAVGLGILTVFGRAAQSQTSPSTPVARAAAPTGTAGSKIAYLKYPDGDGRFTDVELWVMNPDGSGQRRLARRASGASWSPDGQRIAFERIHAHNAEIYVMNADGSQVRRLTRSRAGDHRPVWSPAGQQIAFVRYRGSSSDVYVMNSDGSGQRRLTNSPGEDFGVTWSPDGRMLTFVSTRDGSPEVYVIGADGGEAQRLTNSGGARLHQAAWSPDGQRIVFVSSGPGCSTSCFRLNVMSADGSQLRRLTRRNDWMPSWSPDGRQIAFLRGWPAPRMYVVNADGTGLRRIPHVRSVPEETPVWSPDGRTIALTIAHERRNLGAPHYTYPTHDNFEVYVVNVDGSGLRNLTQGPGDEVGPIWSPAQRS